MRLFPDSGELVQETEKQTHQQDNNQRSQQANSQNISLHIPSSAQCIGNSVVVELKDNISDPLSGEEVTILWNNITVFRGVTDSTGRITCTEMPCGYYQISFGDRRTLIKLLGNEKKEIIIFI